MSDEDPTSTIFFVTDELDRVHLLVDEHGEPVFMEELRSLVKRMEKVCKKLNK